jgi:four helix bundle protein
MAFENKPYNLEERTFRFAKLVRLFVKKLPDTIANREDIRQLVRASGSVGANYIEANDALSKKDFLMHVKISRKEAKEAAYWLDILHETNNLDDDTEIVSLISEAVELKKILSSIITKSS